MKNLLNKENRNIVADNIPVALFRVEFDGEAAHISNSVCGTTTTKDSREAHESGCLAGGVGKNTSRGNV
jgi:hypothetical protein